MGISTWTVDFNTRLDDTGTGEQQDLFHETPADHPLLRAFEEGKLRAPIRNILGFSEILFQKIVQLPDAEAYQSLQYIRNSALQMDKLLADLYTLVAVYQEPIRHEPVNINDLLVLAQNRLRHDWKAAQAQLFFDERENIRFFGDRQLLATLFYHLLQNALRFRSPMRRLELHIQVKSFPGLGLSIQFSDNGCGFPPELIPQAFEVFTQSVPAADVQSNGLGLALCKAIVKAHNGSIRILEASQEGSRLEIRLPY